MAPQVTPSPHGGSVSPQCDAGGPNRSLPISSFHPNPRCSLRDAPTAVPTAGGTRGRRAVAPLPCLSFPFALQAVLCQWPRDEAAASPGSVRLPGRGPSGGAGPGAGEGCGAFISRLRAVGGGPALSLNWVTAGAARGEGWALPRSSAKGCSASRLPRRGGGEGGQILLLAPRRGVNPPLEQRKSPILPNWGGRISVLPRGSLVRTAGGGSLSCCSHWSWGGGSGHSPPPPFGLPFTPPAAPLPPPAASRRPFGSPPHSHQPS